MTLSCFIANLPLALFRSFSQTSGERNVVEIHTTDFSDKEQRHPVASLTLGQKDFANVDLCLTFSKTKEVKFKLVMGSGPVTITGEFSLKLSFRGLSCLLGYSAVTNRVQKCIKSGI